MEGLARSLSVECAIPLDSGLDNGARELDLFEKEMKDNRSRLGTDLKRLESVTKKAGGKGGDQNTLIQAMKDYNAKREEIDQWKSNQLHTVFLIERRRFGEILSATTKVATAQMEYAKVISAMNDDTAGHTKLLGTLEALSSEQIEALSVASQKSYTSLNTSEAANVTLTGSTNSVLTRGGPPSSSPYGTPRTGSTSGGPPSGPPSGAPPPPNFAPGPPSGAPPPPNFAPGPPGPPSGAPPPPNFSPSPPSYMDSGPGAGSTPPPMGLPKMPPRGPPSMPGSSPAASPRPGGGPPPIPGGGPPPSMPGSGGSPGTLRGMNKGPPPPMPGGAGSPRPPGGPPSMPGGPPPSRGPPAPMGMGPPPPMGGPPPPMGAPPAPMGGPPPPPGGGPPPPPPGGAPPPPKAPKASKSSGKKKGGGGGGGGKIGGGDPSEGRNDLLNSISGFKGGLKKTVTNDRSAPVLTEKKSGGGGGPMGMGRGGPPMF